MTTSDQLKTTLERVPIGLLLAAYLGYLGYDYYSFTSDSQSPLIQRQVQYDQLKKENAELQAKVTKAKEFFRGLDAKRDELRRLAEQLTELKGTLSTQVDVPAFMRMAVTEARKVGLAVIGIKPAEPVAKEYYAEHPFDLSFRGVYVQLLVFLDRLSNVPNIVRVDNFDIKPIAASSAPYVELAGVIQIKTFRYIGSQADELASFKPGNTTPSAAQATDSQVRTSSQAGTGGGG